MSNPDIFFDTNIIKVQSDDWDSMHMRVLFDCEPGDLVRNTLDQVKINEDIIWGVALEDAKAGEECLVLYKAESILLPYWSRYGTEEVGALSKIVRYYNEPDPTETQHPDYTVVFGWEGDYADVRLLAPLEPAPQLKYEDDTIILQEPKWSLFELLGSRRRRV